MSSIQEKYKQFRHWQENPFNYYDSQIHHVCCNCGAKSDNNYCPRCGQKAVYGPITWKSVGQGIMDVWGVGTRSLPYSLWQLIWRPGYLIRDYISGKRQASFPPVKMLVILAVFLVLATSLFDLDYEDGSTVESVTAYEGFLDLVFEWLANHIAWAVLIGFSFFIIPVWFLFRQAPRLPRHTLPQGFYIQVFIGVQFVLLHLLIILICLIFSSKPVQGDVLSGLMVFLALPLMVMVDHKQLFGYGWWGTIWRVLFVIPLAMLILKVLVSIGGGVYNLYVHQWHDSVKYLVKGVDRLTLLWVLLEVAIAINSKAWLNGLWRKSLVRVLLAIAALSATTLLCNALDVDNSFASLKETFSGVFESE